MSNRRPFYCNSLIYYIPVFRMSNEEVEMMYRGAPIDSRGNFDYVAFTKVLKHGTKDE
jgi:hypothetical protein